MNIAVVGHVEWGRFVRVNHVPTPGTVMHADDAWEEVAGGGGVAAMQLAQLNGGCEFFTAIGNDELGRRAVAQLEDCGVVVHAAIYDSQPTRSTFVHIDNRNERAITTIGRLRPSGEDESLPWERLADMDAIYFVSGDIQALEYARKSEKLVSTARILPLLQSAGVWLDALVGSGEDYDEMYHPGMLNPAPGLVVRTRGSEGCEVENGKRYKAELISKTDIADAYGCGDSFAAALTLGIGEGLPLDKAVQLATHTGALAMQRRGAFGN